MKHSSVLTFIFGGLVAAIAPAPTDWLHFWLQNYIKVHTELTAHQFWVLQAVDWYLVDAIWWLVLLGLYMLLHFKRLDNVKKMTIWFSVASVGILVGFLAWYLGQGGG